MSLLGFIMVIINICISFINFSNICNIVNEINEKKYFLDSNVLIGI